MAVDQRLDRAKKAYLQGHGEAVGAKVPPLTSGVNPAHRQTRDSPDGRGGELTAHTSAPIACDPQGGGPQLAEAVGETGSRRRTVSSAAPPSAANAMRGSRADQGAAPVESVAGARRRAGDERRLARGRSGDRVHRRVAGVGALRSARAARLARRRGDRVHGRVVRAAGGLARLARPARDRVGARVAASFDCANALAGITSAQMPSPSARARRRRALRLRWEMIVMVCARILGLLWWWPRTWPSDEARFGAGGQRGGCDRAVYARLIRSKSGPAAEVEVGLPGTPTRASRPAALVSPASRAVSLSQPLGVFRGRDVRVARPSAGARCAPVPSPAHKTPLRPAQIGFQRCLLLVSGGPSWNSAG